MTSTDSFRPGPSGIVAKIPSTRLPPRVELEVIHTAAWSAEVNIKVKLRYALIILFALWLPAQVYAQVGSTTDILMGQVSGADSQAVAGARVEATSIETGITRTKITGPDGRYTIIFPDGGGSYRLTVRAIGMAPVTRNVQRQAAEVRLLTDFN